ncbi:MAG: T9SS type A sorting domain-containing protein [Candidatus Zixiibacteriota bacterium]
MAKTGHKRPNAFASFQNHLDSFNPETEISYVLSKDTYVNLNIYNILGQKVKTWVDGFEIAGRKTVRWDGKDEGGNQVTSGVYFYRLEAGEFTATKKMVLIW